MALTGLDIYKLLPKTNCKECGYPTCLAFAMKLAAKQAELAACPDVTEEAKAQLAAAAVPPIRLVIIGRGERKVEVGNETVLFRHEKTFFHPPGLMVRVKDTQPIDMIEKRAREVADYSVEYVGLELRLDGLAVENASGEASAFASAVERVRETGLPLILISSDPGAMEAALAKSVSPLIYAADEENWEAMSELAKKHQAPLAVRASGLEPLVELVEKVRGAGVEDLVLDPGCRGSNDCLVTFTLIRRLALQKNFRPLGFPLIAFPGEEANSPEEEAILAGQHIAKYGGFVVMEDFDPALAYPLLTLRQNIYTDPREPIQVTPGIYEFGKPAPDSPLLITTNFSITYFSVANEVEGSGIPSWLLVADSEGMSVLTGWAAGKFDADRIAKTVKITGIEEKVNHRKLTIPGAVAVLSGELEDELPGWEILVGPREAVDLPAYLKSWKP
jgi:acetyl-CoA decarbonylase/synthase complex subunit gamma